MKKSITVFALVMLMLLLVLYQTAFTQTVIFSENFESGAASTAWATYYKGEDSVKAKPMAQAPKVLATGGNFVGWLQDLDGSYTGSAVAVTGALTLKDYSIEADVYCYVNNSGGSAYTGLVVYADSSKKDFYKMRADFDASDRINFSSLKSANFVPLFNKDFKGADNAGLFPTTDSWHKMKIEVRSTSATVTTIWCYFDGTLLKNSPVTDTISNRVTSGGFGLYAFQQSATGIPGYFDNIVVKTLPATLVQENSSPNAPGDFRLSQNYPNPFNPETRISYRLSTGGFTTLTVHDQLGRTIKTLVAQNQASGEHAVVWDGKDNVGNIVPSGVYFYSLKTGSIIESKKMVLMK